MGDGGDAGDIDYTSLSHCWGASESLSGRMILRFENLGRFKKALPPDALPKTFRDAIYVTQTLGIKYLWVDCLCIIQDCDEDWIREAEMMGHIYANSFLNISADASADSTQGLFRDRPLETNSPCLVDIQDNHPHLDGGEYLCFEGQEWVRLIDNAPLNSRGWVLQERFLSPRVAHFCHDQIMWECHAVKASERFTAGMPLACEKGTTRPLLRPTSQSHDPRRLLELWGYIVGQYTASALTKTSDKLVACSALAERLSTIFPYLTGEYLAGMWKTQLHGQLLWRSASSSNSHASIYRAPSWSWASIDGAVHPNFDCSDYGIRGSKYCSRAMMKIRRATVERTQPYYMFGPATTGHISLSAPLLSVNLIPAKSESNASQKVYDRIFRGTSPSSDSGQKAAATRYMTMMKLGPAGSQQQTSDTLRNRIHTRAGPSTAVVEKLGAAGQEASALVKHPRREPGTVARAKAAVKRMMSSIPGYTGESLRVMAVSEGEYLDAYLFCFDVEHGIVATNAPSSRYTNPVLWAIKHHGLDLTYLSPTLPQTRISKPEVVDPAMELHRKISFGTHNANVWLDSLSDLISDGELFLLPVLCYSCIDAVRDQESCDIHSIGGLILERLSPVSRQFKRIGTCELSQRASVEYLCALGNRDAAGLQFLTQSTENLKILDFVPENWVARELAFVPKEVICHDIEIV